MRIALISCVKTKRQERSQAKDLYTSKFFEYAYKYAKRTCDVVIILSAKYGILHEHDIIDPYNETISKAPKFRRQSWSNGIIRQLNHIFDMEQDTFVLLAGKDYREFLLPHFKNYEIPLEHLGIGQQLQKLKELVG